MKCFQGRTALFSLFVLSCLLFLSQARTSKRTLVILDDLQLRNTHSIFFKSLSDRGHRLSFFKATDPKLRLSVYGEYEYDNLILFAPHSEEFGGDVDVDAILNFIDDGNNVLLGVDTHVADPIREIAQEVGAEFAEDETFVIDHHNFDTSDFTGDHTLIVADDFIDASIITGGTKTPVLFRGISHTLETGNPLLIPILRGSDTSYAASPDAPLQAGAVVGKQNSLITALQARNNARVTVSGSIEFFSDRFFNLPAQKYAAEGQNPRFAKSGNQELAINLTLWTFGERGILRASNIRHQKADSTEQPRTYTIKEDIEYFVDIEEYKGGKWVPYNGTDVQIEFVMIDPHVRLFLEKAEPNSAVFTKRFKIPDRYGIFTFRLEYSRLGYTTLADKTLVTVRPLKHNQYERFIASAYPYYASAFSMMFGLFVFSLFFLYNKESVKAAEKAK